MSTKASLASIVAKEGRLDLEETFGEGNPLLAREPCLAESSLDIGRLRRGDPWTIGLTTIRVVRVYPRELGRVFSL
jgi:hypothetical protein